MTMSEYLEYRTQSLCPQCLGRIEAQHTIEGDQIFQEKTCPEHGSFKTKIWQGKASYAQWTRPKIPIQKRFNMTPVQAGCPFDCGLCPEHGQHTCTAVLDITARCNLDCTYCFAGASADSPPAKRPPDPDLDTLSRLLDRVYQVSPDANLQLSGGEPTLRKDLPQIIAAARQTGFRFVQVNTNGLALARDPDLAPALKAAGLSSIFLQFDGVSDRVYQRLRNQPLFEIKQAAIRACAQNQIGVILVPTLVPGINIQDIGPILKFGLENAPGVRGVHFQPVSFFGRHGAAPSDRDRITIPEILAHIETQTRGMFRAADFKPSSCEHALCAFTGKFIRSDTGPPRALTIFDTACCTPAPAEQGARKARASVVRHWQAPARPAIPDEDENGLDRFIRQAEQGMFTVSGMAFQDVWNLDLERLKGCCIHAVSPDGRLIPFCAYNLTRADGKGLYRK